MTFDLLAVFKLSACITGIFLILVVQRFPGKRRLVQTLFSLLILSLCAIVMSSFLLFSDVYRRFPHLIGIFPNFFFAFGPALYLYVRSLTDTTFSFRRSSLAHFLPLLLIFLWDVPFFTKTAAEKLAVLQNALADPSPEFHIILGLRFLHIGTYLILSLIRLRRYHGRLKNHFSSLERRTFFWLSNLLFASLMVLFGAVAFYLFWIEGLLFRQSFARYLGLWEPLLVYLIGFRALSRPQFFSGGGLSEDQLKKKYPHSNLSPQQAKAYGDRLLRLMEEKKPYFHSDLSLSQLAAMMGIAPVYLSQVINQEMKQNFYDFINRQRIEQAKRRLRNPNLSSAAILAVAFDVGFNSKSTFYEAFKKYTGMTPSQYKKPQASA